MENAFKQGLLCIDEKFIRDIPSNSYGIEFYSYFYLLCAKYLDNFHMKWNRKLGIGVLQYLWKRVGSIGPYTVRHKDLFAIVRRGYSPLGGFYALAITYPPKKKSSESDWFRFFQEFVASDMGDEFLHSDGIEVIIEESLSTENSNPTYTEIVSSGKLLKWIKNAKEARYSVLKGRCRELKDAVLETAWRPERYYDWCIDHEEKMFIGDVLSA
jgi:hypothetical protein